MYISILTILTDLSDLVTDLEFCHLLAQIEYHVHSQDIHLYRQSTKSRSLNTHSMKYKIIMKFKNAEFKCELISSTIQNCFSNQLKGNVVVIIVKALFKFRPNYFKGSSKRTVAAEWKTIETSLIRHSSSSLDKPNFGSRMSPTMATTFSFKISFPYFSLTLLKS